MKQALRLLMVLILSLAGSVPVSAHAQELSAIVQITAPAGIAATAKLSGPSQLIAAKASSGDSNTVEAKLPYGEYLISAPPIWRQGKRYVSEQDQQTVTIGQATNKLNVAYKEAPGFQNLVALAIDDSSAQLGWSGVSTAPEIRRNSSSEAPKSLSEGTAVTADNATLLKDENLNPGTEYSYSFFIDGQRVGSLRIGTSDAKATVNNAYVIDYDTIFTKQDPQILKDNNEDLYTMIWDHSLGLPIIDSTVVVQPSKKYPTGSIVVVKDINADGSTVKISMGSYLDPFAYLNVDTPDLDDKYPTKLTDTQVDNNAAKFDKHQLSSTSSHGSSNASSSFSSGIGYIWTLIFKFFKLLFFPFTALSSDKTSSKNDDQAQSMEPQPVAGHSNSSSTVNLANELSSNRNTLLDSGCDVMGGVNFDFKVNNVDVQFDVVVDKYAFSIIPVTNNTKIAVIFDYDITSSFHAEIECSMSLPKYFNYFSIGPVPITLALVPEVGFTLLEVEQPINIKIANNITGFRYEDVFVTTAPLIHAPTKAEPVFKLGRFESNIDEFSKAGFDIFLSGKLMFGPGVLGEDFVDHDYQGTFIGLFGEFELLNLEFSQSVITNKSGNPKLCSKSVIKGSVSAGFNFTGKFMGMGLDNDLSILNSEWSYADPIYSPAGCELKLEYKSLSGANLENTDDHLIGNQAQLAHLYNIDKSDDGKGKGWWVFSTGKSTDGNIDDYKLVASADMHMGTDTELTGLIGANAYDRITYRAKFVTDKKTVHLKFIYASDEYPEYVNTPNNDYLSVKLGGKECAVVPGTDDLISSRTVNMDVNSSYYFNRRSTAGDNNYRMPFDGRTSIVSCDVEVSGGEVPLEITLADVGDADVDSALFIRNDWLYAD